MFLAMPIVIAIFVLPALAISWVVPSSQLTLTGGVMQAFTAFFDHFHVSWLTPILGIMLITASLGGMMAWLAGPSKGLLLIGRKEGYLPPFFQKVNPAGIQVNILFAQGIIVTIIALLFALIPNVSSVYWIFSVITTQVYLIMYFLMFISAMRLRKSQPDHERGYRAPILPVLAMVGLISAACAFLIGFVPSSQFGSGSTALYVLIIGGGLLVLGLLIPFLFLWLRKPAWKNAVPAPADDEG
jgi:amino acid transporter